VLVRLVVAPHQSGCELKRTGSPQWMRAEQAPGPVAQRGRRLDDVRILDQLAEATLRLLEQRPQESPFSAVTEKRR
jgi:aminoglycoside phosphotransferase